MKRSFLTTIGLLLFLAVPQMFAEIASQLVLVSGIDTCTIGVPDSGPLSIVGCGTLVITSTGAHGTLDVKGTFNGLSVHDTAIGFNDSFYPQLQGLNTVEVKSTAGGVGFSATWSDTSADEAGDPCLQGPFSCLVKAPVSYFITDTFNSALASGSANYKALNDSDTSVDVDVIPATTPINGALGTTLTGTNSSAGGTFANPGVTGPYSLTSKIAVTFTKAGEIDANQQISINGTVPEPAAIVFMGTMLLFTTVGLRRKFARK